MEGITEETIRQLIDQVQQQRLIIENQQKEISSLAEGVKGRGNGGPKPPKPELYKGRRDAVEINSWMDQIRRYSQFYKMTSAETTNIAIFYLAGPARDWWTNLASEVKQDLLSDWSLFCQALKTSFYPIDHERKVMDMIERLTQKGAVAKYVERFEHLRTQVSGVSMDLWKRYFVKGLSPAVKIEAIKYNIDNPMAPLAHLYQRVTTIGDALWSQRTLADDPMDLSNVNMMKNNGRSYAGYRENQKKSEPDQRKSQETRKCFKCGKPGHIQKFCTRKIKFNEIDCDKKADDISPNGLDFQ